jgi:hypothetical protein
VLTGASVVTESQREAVPRNDNGELDTALAFLDFQRESLVKKTQGLTDEQMRRRLVPTETNLLGMIQHMTVGERYWFANYVAGTASPDSDWDFTMLVPALRSAGDVIADYRQACAASNEIVHALADLSQPVARPIEGQLLSVRWVIAHVTTETARHAGHADILRELLDGVTGR